MTNNIPPYLDNQDIDFKKIIRLIVNNWLLILTITAVTLLGAYLYIRYTQPVYTAYGTIIVKDESSNSLGQDAVQLQGLDLFKMNKNLSTEIEIIKSKLMVERALKNMPFPLQVSYFAKGRFKTTDLYRNTPFIVEIDSITGGAYEREFEVKFINNQAFEYDYESDKEEIKQVFKVGETISNQFGIFRIKINPLGQGLNVHDNGYSFIIHYPQSLTGLYRSKVSAVRTSEETSIIAISCEDQVAERAKDFVNTLIDEYTERGIDEKTKVATNTIKFIDEQLQQIRDSLNLSEQDIENFKKEKGITNLNADFALNRFAEYDSRRLEIELALKSLDSLDNHIRSGKDATLISTSNLGAQDAALSSTLTELSKLEIERKNILVNNTLRHHSVRAVDAKVDITRQELLKNIASFRLALQNNLSTINATARNFESKLAQIPNTERQFLGIQRNYSLNENIYLLLLQRRANASIAKAAAVKDNVVLDYAEYGFQIKPKANLAYIMAVFISLTLSFSIIFVRDFMDDTISDRAQVEKLTRVPVLGTVNHAKNAKGSNLVVSQNPKSAVSEAFRSIRTNLQYLASDTENKVVVVTSTISGEGKTFFSLNIASVLAISEKKVLLIGLDLRKPKVHEELNISSDTGISKVLIGRAKANEVIFKTGIQNLDLMPAGPIPPNPSELIMSHHMKSLMEELKLQYDYIIIDTPPIGLVTDALLAMKYADINVYILRQKTSKKIYLDNINKLYADKTIKNLAIVLNDLRINKSYGYYNAYDYRYGYGYGYYEEEKNHNNILQKFVGNLKNLTNNKQN